MKKIMLPGQYRLKKKKAFDATYRNHKIVSDSVITIYCGKTKKDSSLPTRFGFVVSKKYNKRAVKRNRIKRLMRECVRLAIKEKKLDKLNNYMSFIIMPKVSENSFKLKLKDVENSFYKLIQKIK